LRGGADDELGPFRVRAVRPDLSVTRAAGSGGGAPWWLGRDVWATLRPVIEVEKIAVRCRDGYRKVIRAEIEVERDLSWTLRSTTGGNIGGAPGGMTDFRRRGYHAREGSHANFAFGSAARRRRPPRLPRILDRSGSGFAFADGILRQCEAIDEVVFHGDDPSSRSRRY
jgi:hypothetical protein